MCALVLRLCCCSYGGLEEIGHTNRWLDQQNTVSYGPFDNLAESG